MSSAALVILMLTANPSPDAGTLKSWIEMPSGPISEAGRQCFQQQDRAREARETAINARAALEDLYDSGLRSGSNEVQKAWVELEARLRTAFVEEGKAHECMEQRSRANLEKHSETLRGRSHPAMRDGGS